MTPGNHRRIALSEIRRLQGSPELPVRCALYARVSTFKQAQAGNLERQSERLRVAARTRQYDIVANIAEYASSLNEKRRGMNKLFSLVENQAIDVVLIEYPDRLVRFGLPYLEQAFGGPGVRLEVLEQRKPLEPTEELTQDLLMLMRGVLRQAVRLPLASEGEVRGLTH